MATSPIEAADILASARLWRDGQFMKTDSSLPELNPASRVGIRRTVWILAACAVGFYLLFLLSVLAGK